MSTPLLALNHPLIERHTRLGLKFGQRADVLTYHAQFLMGADRIQMMDEAVDMTSLAQGHFGIVHRHADYSEPDVRLSNATWRAFEAERERAANEPRTIYPGKGAHWATKRALQAA